jgi:hypothetical protein
MSEISDVPAAANKCNDLVTATVLNYSADSILTLHLKGKASRPAPRPTQPPIQCVLEAVSPVEKWPEHE